MRGAAACGSGRRGRAASTGRSSSRPKRLHGGNCSASRPSRYASSERIKTGGEDEQREARRHAAADAEDEQREAQRRAAAAAAQANAAAKSAAMAG